MLRKAYKLILSAALALALSLFPFAQAQDGSALMLGFPSHFYTLHHTAHGSYEAHFALGGFLVNAALIYAVLTLCCHLYHKYRKA